MMTHKEYYSNGGDQTNEKIGGTKIKKEEEDIYSSNVWNCCIEGYIAMSYVRVHAIHSDGSKEGEGIFHNLSLILNLYRKVLCNNNSAVKLIIIFSFLFCTIIMLMYLRCTCSMFLFYSVRLCGLLHFIFDPIILFHKETFVLSMDYSP